ncbi:Hypothetical predicted protein [Octopus vulgaris]|uniref:Ig-like domain-containing protein n=1 Tax=Octopus vulgaris TaxID=6645 RepID=A0AA36AVX1_OCTVU|nr:Hypothetical predicted protein [Octopus vulgaris]
MNSPSTSTRRKEPTRSGSPMCPLKIFPYLLLVSALHFWDQGAEASTLHKRLSGLVESMTKSASLGGQQVLNCHVSLPVGKKKPHVIQWNKAGLDQPVYMRYDNYPPQINGRFEGRLKIIHEVDITSDFRKKHHVVTVITVTHIIVVVFVANIIAFFVRQQLLFAFTIAIAVATIAAVILVFVFVVVLVVVIALLPTAAAAVVTNVANHLFKYKNDEKRKEQRTICIDEIVEIYDCKDIEEMNYEAETFIRFQEKRKKSSP